MKTKDLAEVTLSVLGVYAIFHAALFLPGLWQLIQMLSSTFSEEHTDTATRLIR